MDRLPDEDAPALMLIPDPSCALMGRMYIAGQNVTADVSYDDPVMCKNFDSQRLAIKDLRVDGTLTFGFRYQPNEMPVLLHCAPTIAIIAALKPVVRFRVTGNVELRPGKSWTTANNIGVPHYEISRSDLAFTRLDVAHVDPFADAIRDVVRGKILDGVDKAVAERANQSTCLCSDKPPTSADYPLYFDGYDPR